MVIFPMNIFFEWEKNNGENMANEMLEYLRNDYKVDFIKCWQKLYDSETNMVDRYNGMQPNF
jgi:hypothetical protein